MINAQAQAATIKAPDIATTVVFHLNRGIIPILVYVDHDVPLAIVMYVVLPEHRLGGVVWVPPEPGSTDNDDMITTNEGLHNTPKGLGTQALVPVGVRVRGRVARTGRGRIHLALHAPCRCLSAPAGLSEVFGVLQGCCTSLRAVLSRCFHVGRNVVPPLAASRFLADSASSSRFRMAWRSGTSTYCWVRSG